MDFEITAEQGMLRDLARELLHAESPPATVRRLMADDDGRGYDERLWQQMAEMGLHGLTVPPTYGGQGLGMVELAVVLEEMGRAVYPGPFFASTVLAAAVLAASGDTNQMERYLPRLTAGELRATLALAEEQWVGNAGLPTLVARPTPPGFCLEGTQRLVPWGAEADLVLVAARTADEGTTLFAIERGAAGVAIRPERGMDRTSRTATLVFDGVRVGPEAVVGRVGEARASLDVALTRAAVAASAEMLGAARRCLELSVGYVAVREQFGRPIGGFQAIKHTCANMLLDVENAHAATYYAAWALDAADPAAAQLAASVCKSTVSEAARLVGASAIQVHGGIGFTWEYDLHLYVKRARHYAALYGDAEHHRERVLRGIEDAPWLLGIGTA